MDPYDIVTSSLSTTIGLTWRGSKQSKKKSIDMKRWIVMHGHAEIAANVSECFQKSKRQDCFGSFECFDFFAETRGSQNMRVPLPRSDN